SWSSAVQSSCSKWASSVVISSRNRSSSVLDAEASPDCVATSVSGAERCPATSVSGAERCAATSDSAAERSASVSGGCAAASCATERTNAAKSGAARATMRRSIRRRRRSKDLPEAIRLQLSNDAGLLHGLDQPCRAVVTDLQAPLNARDRGLAGFRDDPHRLIVKGILLPVYRPAHVAGGARHAVAGRTLEH